MGHVFVPIEIVNPYDLTRSITVDDALVDTGSTRTTIPRELAEELGLTIVGTFEAQSAAGPVTLDHSFALMKLDGRETYSDIFVSDDYAGVLIGVVTLQILGLVVDPEAERLVRREFLIL